MSDYKRIFEPGGQYFFTVNIQNRRDDLLIRHIEILRKSFKDIAKRHSFKTLAICVLPDHLHCLWELPEGDSDYPKRWRLIKSGFTRGLRNVGYEGPVWQSRYWEHHIRDDVDLNNHIDYIHANPFTHGYVNDLKDWPYSSWHLQEEALKKDIAINHAKWNQMKFGER